MCSPLAGSWSCFVYNILIVLLLMVKGFDVDVWVLFGFWHKLCDLTNLMLTFLYHHQTKGIEIEAYTATIPFLTPEKSICPKGHPVKGDWQHFSWVRQVLSEFHPINNIGIDFYHLFISFGQGTFLWGCANLAENRCFMQWWFGRHLISEIELDGASLTKNPVCWVPDSTRFLSHFSCWFLAKVRISSCVLCFVFFCSDFYHLLQSSLISLAANWYTDSTMCYHSLRRT